MPTQYSQKEMLQLLKGFVSQCRTQNEAAEQLGITGPYMSELVRGTRPITEAIAEKLGYIRKEVFEKEGE